ncbi:hypothetical protein [Kitasatospora griseola]|uniref:hypothetical protein n=1 Tax=Kitasatospora griseola TaxID=2064 RepID=UPI003658A8FB
MTKKLAVRTAVVVLGLGAVIGSAPAFALTSSTAGSTAYTSTTSATDDTMNVSDTSADSRAAYGQYKRQANAGTTLNLWNKSGSGTTVSASDGSRIFTIRACRQEQWDSDTCAGWVA